MSSLLDEAIVDAKALREAVLKNAEASLLEAYAPKIEEAVASILEQEVDMGAMPMDIGAPPGGLGMADPAADDAVDETGSTFLAGEEEDICEVDYAALTDLDDDSALEEDVDFDITRGELTAMLESINQDIEKLEEMEAEATDESEDELPPAMYEALEEDQIELTE